MDISILIPVYGDGPYLMETLNSISDQTFQGKIETLVILDRCPPSVKERITSVAWKFVLKTFETSKPGLVPALNLGLEKSTGKYIARIDSDDVMLSNRLEIQFEHLEKHPNLTVLGTSVFEIDESGKEIGLRSFPTEPRKLSRALNFQCRIAHPSILMRAEIVRMHDGYRSFYKDAEDYDLWLRLKKSYEIANLDVPLTKYRIHSNQISKLERNSRVTASYLVRLDHFLSHFFKVEMENKYKSYENLVNSKLGNFISIYVNFRLKISDEMYKLENTLNDTEHESKSLVYIILYQIKKIKSFLISRH